MAPRIISNNQIFPEKHGLEIHSNKISNISAYSVYLVALYYISYSLYGGKLVTMVVSFVGLHNAHLN